ncbi:hypothetical protein ACHAW6_002791 [Cyclotella cf. meneghiniana]
MRSEIMYGSLLIILIAQLLCPRILSFPLHLTSLTSRSPLFQKACGAIMNPDFDHANNPLPGDNAADDSTFGKRMRTDAPLSSSLEVPSSAPAMGTLYITIGPQCSGKTTILKRIFGKSFHKNEETTTGATALVGGIDITIDDQALVYVPVPIHYFLRELNANPAADRNAEGNGISPSMTVLGKTIQERINDTSNDELRLVIQRLGGLISSEQFASLLRADGESADDTLIHSSEQLENPNPIHVDLLAAIESIMSSKEESERMPKEVDLFIVESIFRPRPLELIRNITREFSSGSSTAESSALDAALDQLKSHATDNHTHPRTAPLAWGNTNTRPREYKSALEAASLSGRPVEFIVFGGMETCNMIREHLSRREYRMSYDGESMIRDHDIDHGSNIEDHYQIRCLPKITRIELFRRNLQRFATTGKYIPSGAIHDAIVRVESLLASVAADAKKNFDNTSKLTLEAAKFRLDYELAMLGGYVLHPDRTVSLASTPNFNKKTDGRTTDLKRDNRQYVGGRYGRGQAERARGYSHNYQERNFHEGRWTDGRESNLRQNDDGEIRYDGNYQQGQGWNHSSSHVQDRLRRDNNRYYSNFNSTQHNHAPYRWGQGSWSSMHSRWQSDYTRYDYQQGNQYNSYSTNHIRRTNAFNKFNDSHNSDNQNGLNNSNNQNP